MSEEQVDIAIVGAGLGGAAAMALLHHKGLKAHLFEQAPAFDRLGAGIHIGPNVMKIFREIGLEDRMAQIGAHPDFWFSRDGNTGDYRSKIKLGDYAKSEYGAPYITIHRGDMHATQIEALPQDYLHYGHCLSGVEERENDVKLSFTNGSTVIAKLVIGADGINSKIREELLGVEKPRFSGWVGHRCLLDMDKLKSSGLEFETCVKWWWDRSKHIMAYATKNDESEYYYVTGVPDQTWDHEASWIESSRDEMEATFGNSHPVVNALIDATTEVTKWPFWNRDPLSLWSQGRLCLLGDACHPMRPHMAQGACMAIEDAVVLARCLSATGIEDYANAFEIYENTRRERATEVQTISNANTWLKEPEDPSWVYGHNALTTPLAG